VDRDRQTDTDCSIMQSFPKNNSSQCTDIRHLIQPEPSEREEIDVRGTYCTVAAPSGPYMK